MAIKLKDVYIFEWISMDQITMIIDNSRRETIKQWEIIINQWDDSDDNAYLIQDWTVGIEIDWKEVKEVEEWNVFWEIALITNEARTATVKAKSDLVLLKINKDLLFTIIRKFENWAEIQKTLMKRIMENTKN